MVWNNITNNETGLSVRTKINTMGNDVDVLKAQVYINIIGDWDASINSPDIITTSMKIGEARTIIVAGIQFGIDFQVGDIIVRKKDDTGYFKIDNTDYFISANNEMKLINPEDFNFQNKGLKDNTSTNPIKLTDINNGEFSTINKTITGAVNEIIITKSNKNITIIGNNGLIGGGDLSSNRIISGVDATIIEKGVVQLSNTYNGISEIKATTEKAISDGLSQKQNYITNPINNNVITTNSIGQTQDSGKKFSNDGFMLENSDNNIPTEKAIVSYISKALLQLPTLQGNYDASLLLFPEKRKDNISNIEGGDFWIISVDGVLGGQKVEAGDFLYAIIDIPGQNITNWAIIDKNLGYTPEDITNKLSNFQTIPDNNHYVSEKLIADNMKNSYICVETESELYTISTSIRKNNQIAYVYENQSLYKYNIISLSWELFVPSYSQKIREVTSTTSALPYDYTIIFNPPSSGSDSYCYITSDVTMGKILCVKNTSDKFKFILYAINGRRIDDDSLYTLNYNESIIIHFNGSDWKILAKYGINTQSIIEIKTTDFTIENNKTYFINNTIVTNATLPATIEVGFNFKIIDKTGNKFKITQNAGQQIYLKTYSTTIGETGYIASIDKGDSYELVCYEENKLECFLITKIDNIEIV